MFFKGRKHRQFLFFCFQIKNRKDEQKKNEKEANLMERRVRPHRSSAGYNSIYQRRCTVLAQRPCIWCMGNLGYGKIPCTVYRSKARRTGST